MDNQQDIEIYVKDANLAMVQGWLEKKLGSTLSRVPSSQADVAHYSAESDKQKLAVTVTVGCECPPMPGKYTSVYFVSSEVPWANDVECAREAVVHFSTEIICDPASLGHAKSGEWLLITPRGESLFLGT